MLEENINIFQSAVLLTILKVRKKKKNYQIPSFPDIPPTITRDGIYYYNIILLIQIHLLQNGYYECIIA